MAPDERLDGVDVGGQSAGRLRAAHGDDPRDVEAAERIGRAVPVGADGMRGLGEDVDESSSLVDRQRAVRARGPTPAGPAAPRAARDATRWVVTPAKAYPPSRISGVSPENRS